MIHISHRAIHGPMFFQVVLVEGRRELPVGQDAVIRPHNFSRILIDNFIDAYEHIAFTDVPVNDAYFTGTGVRYIYHQFRCL